MYTNRKSLESTWSIKEVETLCKGKDGKFDQDKLEKAADTAEEIINTHLAQAGYKLPLAFTAYGYIPVGVNDPPVAKLNSYVQQFSDCLTAYYLSRAEDVSKKQYVDCYKETMSFLEGLVSGKKTLQLERESAQVVVVSRPQVLNLSALSQAYVSNPRRYTE